jgi:hypothetical protein
MTSVGAAPKQSNGHFIAVASVSNVIQYYTPGSGSGASFTVGSFSTINSASGSDNWVQGVAALTAQGALFKDLGQTLVSANRLFRKVAPVIPGTTANPFGNSGTAVSYGVSTSVTGVPLVGYFEMGYEGFGTAAPIARFNTL